MSEYEVETFSTVDDLVIRLEQIKQNRDIKVIPLPYWRRDAPHYSGFVKDESDITVFGTPIIFPALSKIRVQVTSHATDTLAFVNMRGYIEQVGE